ncbi:MAG: hypothetical protein NDJ94_14615 [Vicinamibacteria bacterium]|nr:hypothetical protein [Vicinamibacteria bacterium]
MLLHATAAGLRAISRHRRLVLVLWAFGLALSLAATFPLWRALAAAIGPLPHADSLSFSAEIFADLVELRPGLMTGLGAAAASTFGLGVLVGIVFAGGALEVLTSRDDRPFAHRFGRGAFRFFGRFLRLGAITCAIALPLAALVGGPLFALSTRLRRDSGSEWLAIGTWGAALLAIGLVVLVVLLVQDAARVRIVTTDERRVRKALRPALSTVWRGKAAWLGTWMLNALALLVLFAAYLAVAEAIPAGRALFLLLLLQQAFVLSRCGLRVALLGSEVALVEALTPAPPPTPVEPLPAHPPDSAPEPPLA